MTYEITPIIPFIVENAYIGAENTLNIVTDKNKHIIINTKRTGAYMYMSLRTKKKIKHGFNDILSSLLKGRRIEHANQHCMDRIAILKTSNNVQIFIQFIPGRFNFIITDRDKRIINQYSHLKNSNDEVEYAIDDVYQMPQCRDELSSYLTTAEMACLERGVSVDDIMKENMHYAYLEKRAFSILPFFSDNAMFSGVNVSDIIEQILTYQHDAEQNNIIETALGKLEKQKDRIRRDIEKLSETERIQRQINEFREYGETLKMHLHNMNKNQYIDVPSVYNADKMLHIKLNPALSPADNMKHFFKEAERKERQLKSNEKRIEELNRQVELIDRNIEHVRTGDMSIAVKSAKKKNRQEKRIGRYYVSPSGFNIIAGRNAKENDYITVHIASKNDLFFHAREKHGSHVIMQTQGRPCRHEDIEYAASIAAYYSDGKHSSLVPVQYTQAKYVTKRRKSPPGTVQMTREEVIMVKPSNY